MPKILIIDDDKRNIFALSATLKQKGFEFINALYAQEGINILEKEQDISAVMLDMMMPEIDGYELISIIRDNDRFKAMPIIAVTAKAMKGDREKCIDAGASDYITKPVKIDQLLSLMRVWLYK